MLRLVNNPPNPYLSQHREWLEPPPNAQIEVYEESAKSILSENDSPDIPFRWSINPYRGCQHACAYCYARPTHEYLNLGAGTDFDTKLIAKINAPELLRTVFTKRGWQWESISFSGVTDCYQPIEAAYQLTRRCLEVCLEFKNPASIITKGCLVLRDIDLLRDLHRVTGARVYQSICFADDKHAKLIEPQAPSPSRRFDVMKKLCDAGIPVGVMVAPIIPGLNDTQMPDILKRAAEAGATSAGYMALRLPKNVAPVFIDRIRAALPDRAPRIEARIREMRDGALNKSAFGDRMRGEGPYWQNVTALFRIAAEKHGINIVRRATAETEESDRKSPLQPISTSLPLFPDVAAMRPRRDPRQMRFDFTE